MSSDEVIIFIDGSNLYHSLKRGLKMKKLNLSKFVEMLTNKRKLKEVNYYNAPKVPAGTEAAEIHRRFIEYVKSLPKFKVKLGKISRKTKFCFACEKYSKVAVEKKVDVMIATDMFAAAISGKCGTIILVSGDNDFTYVVSEIKKLDIDVEVACFRNSLAAELRGSATHVITLDKLKLDETCKRKPLTELGF
ncbi:MAG: NYN domain-containing protein [Candidatus Altiarchaeota archaeon]|nr:NYN domain-containing protein [Candidatus Altiarchaeota archaeon]